MSDRLNLSADLMRIGGWIYQGKDELAARFLDRDIRLYSKMNVKIGNETVGVWLDKIKNRLGGRVRAAERALTAGVILASG